MRERRNKNKEEERKRGGEPQRTGQSTDHKENIRRYKRGDNCFGGRSVKPEMGQQHAVSKENKISLI